MPEDQSPQNWLGINTADKETLTISAGDITPANQFAIVAAQTGVTDFLDGIITSGIQAPGDADGAVIYLMADAGDTITIRHNQNSGATKNVLTSSGASVVMTGNTVIRAILNIDLDTNGAWVVDAVVAASLTVAGIVELATPTEINTGTDATRAMSPDAFAASNPGVRLVSIPCFAPGTDCATGDGKAFFGITEELNGMNLVSARALVFTAGTTNSMTIAVYNITDSVDMLSTLLTVATTAVWDDENAVIDTTKDDVVTEDRLRIDVDTLHTTKAQGLVVVLGFRRP